jgi:uncharacterized membrane protein
MYERPFWPRRGLNIAMEGSRLRLTDFSRRVSTRPESPMSPRMLWFAMSLVLFVGYSISFVTLGSISFAHGFEDAARPLSLLVGTIVVIFGVLLFMLGLKTAIHTRSRRASWPSLVLGGSLIAAVGCDWWLSSLGGEWGWASITNSFVSLDPFAWRSIFAAPQDSAWGWPSEIHFYIVINLCLLSMIAVSSTTLVHRLRPSVRTERRARSAGVMLIIGMLAVISAAWVWVIDSSGQNQAPVFIASALTVAVASTLLALLGGKSRRVVPG